MEKPEVAIPDGPPSYQLELEDITVGDGDARRHAPRSACCACRVPSPPGAGGAFSHSRPNLEGVRAVYPGMKRSRLLLPIVALTIPVALSACGSDGSATASAATSGRALQVHSSSLGKILVDSKGRTLYAFGHDLKNKSRCSGACASNWPPALTKAKKPKVGAGVSSAKLRVIKRAGGARQLSYNGHPLYRFSLDSKPGDMNGQGLNAFGGTWHVVSPAGKPVTHAPQSSTPSGGGYSPGGGY